MDERKIEILNAIVNSYIDSPSPVGSRTISKDFNLGVSSATVRNEMADLEDLGYLNKPHTSAGRVPSDKAYRFFVDELQKSFHYTASQASQVGRLLRENATDMATLFNNAAKHLAKLTGCTSYVVSLKKSDTKIKFIQLLNINVCTILLLIVGDRGVVEQQIINIDEPIKDEDLDTIKNSLNEYLHDIDFSEIESLKIVLKGNMSKYKSLITEVIKRASKFNETVSSVDLYYDGISNILNFEEYSDIDKAREFISFIENRDSILELLSEKYYGNDFDIIIGSENSIDLMKGNSLIRATFTPENQRKGLIGIIGPVRMNYRENIQLVKIFRDELSLIIDEIVR